MNQHAFPQRQNPVASRETNQIFSSRVRTAAAAVRCCGIAPFWDGRRSRLRNGSALALDPEPMRQENACFTPLRGTVQLGQNFLQLIDKLRVPRNKDASTEAVHTSVEAARLMNRIGQGSRWQRKTTIHTTKLQLYGP